MSTLNRRAKRRAVRRLTILGDARVCVRVEMDHRVAIGTELSVHGGEHGVRERVVAADHDGDGVGRECGASGFGQERVRAGEVAGDNIDVTPVDDVQLFEGVDARVHAWAIARDIDVFGRANRLRTKARARAIRDALIERGADHNSVGRRHIGTRRDERHTAERANDAVERVVRAVDRVVRRVAHCSEISQSFWTSAVVEAEIKQSRSALPINSFALAACPAATTTRGRWCTWTKA